MSATRIFVTGGGGFVGKVLLRALRQSEEFSVVALDRSGTIEVEKGDGAFRVVRGDLHDPTAYAAELARCDVVLHLASATGKAPADRHARDTALATEVLLEAARNTGVARFLFVSSIAASFPDTRDYPYAASKVRAERAVAASGLRFAIVRPTMILGERAPILTALSTLARLPVAVIPGSGRVRVQPVDVSDIVRALLAVLRNDRFHSETLDVGGPDVVTMEELLRRIRDRTRGSRGPVLHIPVRLIQAPLRIAELIGLGKLLPATAAQFSSFRHDGVASPNALLPAAPPGVDLDRMVGYGRSDDVTARRHEERECRVFTRYLLGMEPDALVVRSYLQALHLVPALAPRSAWDRALLAMACRGTLAARCADAHAALFARSSTLRKRLVMLLAILETRPPFAGEIDRALGGSVAPALARLGLAGLGSVVALVVGSVVLLPVRLLLTLRPGPDQ